MKRDINKKSDLSAQLAALTMRNTFNMLSMLSTLSGKYAVYWLFGMTLLTACRNSGQSEGDTIDFARWTNPVT
ncbi:MAG: hypothetical protein VX792_14065, partial [Candidatus Latescibacterota bacterium]|nr:hypothetical protein [Candidatus Latescibacterota bacterium]